MPFIYRFLFYIVGLFIISFGASLTIKANVGAGAWDALNVGLSRLTGLSVGTFVIIVGITLMFVNASIVKRRPDFFALFTIFILGPLIDFWMIVVLGQFAPSQLLVKVLFLVLGLLIIGLGVAIYLQPKFPLNPIDNLMMSLNERFGISIPIAKTICEALALVLALLAKGPIGLGTFICLILIGPFIQLFVPTFEKLSQRLSVKK